MKLILNPIKYLLFVCPFFLTASSVARAVPVLDTLTFADSESEKSHQSTAVHSDIITGGINTPARRLLPIDPTDWRGGSLSFNIKVDPDQQNYITLRLWGDDVSNNRLLLYCDGRQIGYRHLGDVDILDYGTEEPGYNGRFFYNTSPLPISLTKGKSTIACEIRSTGPIWGYGTTFKQYQKPMIQPTRGIYAFYTHTESCFVPPVQETQGTSPVNPPVRDRPGIEVLDGLKKRVTTELNQLLADGKPLDQIQMHLLALAYPVSWSPAYRNPRAIKQIVRACDALCVAYQHNPALAESDPAVYNPDWFGFGMMGDCIRLLAIPLQPFLDQHLVGTTINRRAGWSQMLQASRDWHRYHRRMYTNQSMIIDTNIYRDNRGVAVIDPEHALPEDRALHYLYQSIGLEPWLGSDTDHGPDMSAGENYYELTSKGLTKELGYVGTYGEVLDWVTQIYDATREPGKPGDLKIKKQLEKIALARAVFRYPMLDADGNRAMRMETIVGWRDSHYPGDVTYAQRTTWDSSCLYTAAATLDSDAIGFSQQMLADNQFFNLLQGSVKERGIRTTVSLLGVPDQYVALSSQPPSPRRLPMTPGQPDFVWADKQDGVVAVRHGEEILYVSLYWRARYAINFLARVHYILPHFSQIAVVNEETQFDPSGLTYTRPDWTDQDFGNGGYHYPGDPHSALAGEKLPIAKIPIGMKFKPGDENAYAGRGSFYSLRYGHYLIGMNCTTGSTFDLHVPDGIKSAVDVSNAQTAGAGDTLHVKPQSTLVLYLN